MKTLISVLLALFVTSVFLITGCSSSQTDAAKIEGKWVLQTLNGKEILKEKAGSVIPFIEINQKDGKLFGNTGCNDLYGNSNVSGNEITFGNVGMTKINCSDAEYEIDFVSAVKSGVLKYKIENNKLTFSKNDKVIMVFVKAN